MSKNKYNLRHIRCNLSDFLSDIHRFSFIYDNMKYIATCHAKLSIHLSTELPFFVDPPIEVLDEIYELIYNSIDKNELKWRYPKEAYQICNRYYAENFAS